MAIQSEIVQDVVSLYETWFDRLYPSTDWTRFQDRIQKAVNNCAVTAPLPRINLKSPEHNISGELAATTLLRMNVHEARRVKSISPGNPLAMEPELYAPELKNGHHAKYAGRVAQVLYEAGHPVFYLNRALPLGSAQYQGVDQLIADIMAFAPVVVYHESIEGHKHGWVRDLLLTRQYGIAFFIREVFNGK